MVIKHNALIVLEDLNGGFKRGRQKVEKNVYQQFELALAKKLNYLVFKDTPGNQPGGTLHGYQLTPPVAQFQDLQYQTGAILYTPAGYTSTTCPCCGWRKNLYLSYTNEKQAKEVLKKLMINQKDK
jgi:CRISPR-associated protein Cpf1